MGPSGCGKTTLLNCLSGLDAIDAGEIRIEGVRDPESGKARALTVIGVLADTTPQDMGGIWASQQTATMLFGARATPTIHHVAVGRGVDPDATARRLERAFLANGREADSTRKLLHDAIGASYTLNWLLLGFMGLGLIVGVAGLGVISARSVVERRQQIGVLRSIGFRRGMVQLSFLLESSLIALSAIAIGTALGLVIAYNVIRTPRTSRPGRARCASRCRGCTSGSCSSPSTRPRC